jgi:hypothetical protein
MKTFPTKINLKSNVKAISIELLNARVADCIDLALLTKQAHWNLKGPQFIAVHEMLDGFRTQVDDYVDTMLNGSPNWAERRSERPRRLPRARRWRPIRSISTASPTICMP